MVLGVGGLGFVYLIYCMKLMSSCWTHCMKYLFVNGWVRIEAIHNEFLLSSKIVSVCICVYFYFEWMTACVQCPGVFVACVCVGVLMCIINLSQTQWHSLGLYISNFQMATLMPILFTQAPLAYVCMCVHVHACNTWCCLTVPNLMEVKHSCKITGVCHISVCATP